MGMIAGFFGGIGGLCTVMGIITALEVIKPINEELTWMFWFVLSAILLLASIAMMNAKVGGGD